MRISLIGAGDVDYHYFELLKLDRSVFYEEIKEIAKTLADKSIEIVLVPDRGLPFEIAKLYKGFGGKKAIGTVPLSDKDFGIAHLMQYKDAMIRSKKIFSEIINTDNWYKQDLTGCLFADAILFLGLSTGSLGDLAYAFYLYKLFNGDKPGVQSKREKIHPSIIAGKNMPFTVFVYKPFIKEKLPYELEEYIKKYNGVIKYLNNIKELKSSL